MTPKGERLVITVSATIAAPLQQVWDLFTDPMHIIHWSHASDDWQTSYAESDLRPGGAFLSHMEAKDGSGGFDFSGRFTEITPCKTIAYTLDDGRNVDILFRETAGRTLIMKSFETEEVNSAELQRNGWQAILDNFRKYAEGYGRRVKLHFETTIENTPENIFRIMLGSESYSKWTQPFNPESHFTGSWEKGERILFLGTGEDGKSGGMLCRVRENIPGKFVSIESVREVADGKEVTGGYGDAWIGALENYTLKPAGDKTLLLIDTDVPADSRQFIEEAWPRALETLKALCE